MPFLQKGKRGKKLFRQEAVFVVPSAEQRFLGFFPVGQQNRAAVLRVGEKVWFRTNQKISESQKEYLIIS